MPRPTPFVIRPPDDFLQQYPGLHTLPVIVECGDPAIASLPWEALHHPTHGFLGRAPGFALSRRTSGAAPSLPDIEKGPLRVLLFTALPDDLSEADRLDVEAEQAAAQEALLEAERAGAVVLEMPDDGRFRTFQEALRDFKPHLVYLSGHGTFTHEAHSKKAWGSFLFEDEWGNQQLVDQDTVAECFQNTPVQLAVISACLSARQHPKFPDSGLSQALFRAGVPHVVGVRESVFDMAGIQFARALLGALADRQLVDIAAQTARAAIVRPLAGSIPGLPDDPAREQLSFGQWRLPQLLSRDPGRALVDWDFAPRPPARQSFNQTLSAVSLPERFVGRRRELRQWQNRLRRGQANSLLITGAGGMGKTALAGKLAATLLKDGHAAFVFSARPEHDWRDAVLNMEMALGADNTSRYTFIQQKNLGEAENAAWLLRLLLEQHQGKLVLFFDNLESVQDAATRALTDAGLQVWLEAARALSGQGLKLIVTSRWRLPGWPEAEHYPLGRPVYGDTLAFARRQNLPPDFLGDPTRLRQAYQTLGGNFRALEFFAAAMKGMNLKQEQAFLDALARAEAEIQTDMAIAEVAAQRSPAERALLHRLLAYATPAPLDGVKAIARPDLPDAPALLAALAGVSLVEQYRDGRDGHAEYQLSPLVRDGHAEYQLSPLVRDWLLANGAPPPTLAQLRVAAEFLLWLWDEDIKTTWQHSLATHQALVTAQRTEQAHRFVLDWIIGPLNRAGLYRTLLNEWLPALEQTTNPKTRGEALGQIGKQHIHLGNYDTALTYLQQSLAIRREIGDKSGEGTTLNNLATTAHARGDYDTALTYLQQSLAIRREIGDVAGLCATLFNIGHIHWQKDEQGEAVEAWVTVYGIAKKINLAQALQALEGLAGQLGLEGGLAGWEALAQRFGSTDEQRTNG